MGTRHKPARTVKAAETTFTILEALAEADGIRLTDLADDLDMAKSTVHRYLQTLLAKEYLVKEGEEYHPSLRFLDLGEHARNREKGYRMSKAKVAELAEETNERAQFIVEEHGEAVYVHREAGSHAVHTDPGIGKRTSIHATSAGKAILSEWDDDRIAAFVDQHGLPALTEQTITDFEKLMAEIEEIRDRGYAVNEQENITGLCAVGVAVCHEPGEVLGALSITGPKDRMNGAYFEEEIPSLLMGTANEMELNLQHS
jgi:DNA-binding IclR family transcriptional regulator